VGYTPGPEVFVAEPNYAPLHSGVRINARVADRLEQAGVAILWVWLLYRTWPPAFTLEHAWAVLLVISEGAVLVFLLVRRPTERISLRARDWLLAAAGSFLPLLVNSSGPALAPAAGTLLLLVGLVIHVAAKLSLNVSFGLVAANRGVKRRGLYRVVRHPMYAGYILSHLGFLLVRASWWNLALYSLELVLQMLRIRAEERVLNADESYRTFAEQVRYRLLPGVY
jgi:protein-S-isoprenylcysteine O-methyltransferase Ste14